MGQGSDGDEARLNSQGSKPVPFEKRNSSFLNVQFKELCHLKHIYIENSKGNAMELG